MGSDKVSAAVDRIRSCGLREASTGDMQWLRSLAGLLSQAYERDKGQFYRELSQQVDVYLASTVSK